MCGSHQISTKQCCDAHFLVVCMLVSFHSGKSIVSLFISWLVRTPLISSGHPCLAHSKPSQKLVQENDDARTSHSVSLPSFRCCFVILFVGFLASSQMGKRKDVGESRAYERKRSLLGGRDVLQRNQVGEDPTLTMVTICAEF